MLAGRFDQHFLEIFAKSQNTPQPVTSLPKLDGALDDLSRWHRFTWLKRT